MKKVFRFLLMSSVSLWGGLYAQTTVQIGTGTQAPLTNGSIYSPICRFGATSTNDCSRGNILYTDAELANVGITAGAIINKIAFYKIGTGASTAGFTFEIHMRNSSTQPPLSTATTWADILSTHTPVYATTTQDIPATAGWVEFTLNTPFLYSGGSIEIATTHDMTGVSGNPSTGPFDWQYTDGFEDYVIGAVSTALPTILSGTVTNYKVRPNIQITYTAGTACNGMPLGGTATGSASICPGIPVTYSVSGSTSESGMAYQWQSSPDGFVWTNISGATGFAYTTVPASGVNYKRLTVCIATNDTAESTPISTIINPFLDCYCSSNATAATNASIKNVTFSNINATSATACDQYTENLSDTGIVNQGVDYPVSVLVEDCEGVTFGTQRVAIFVDWNQNGNFTDPGEMVYDPGTQTGAATVLFTGNITVPLTATMGVTKMRVINKQAATAIDPCGTYTTGETEDYLLRIVPPPADDAGVLAITRPAISSCSLGSEIWVNMQNLGSNALTSAVFTVTVNGFVLTGNWTGNVPAASTAEVLVPITYTFADGDSVHVSVSMPNGVVENPIFAFNNSTGRRLYAGVSGNKTVYGVTPDFANLNDALQALSFRGVCDTVNLKIASGNYTTQHIIPQYLNTGPGRLVIIESATGNAADVSFSYAGSSASDNYVFLFDNADGYIMRNITAKATGTSFSRVVDIRNGTDGLLLEKNVFVGDTAGTFSTTDVTRVVVASANTTEDVGTVIRNNHIIGGSRGIHLAGPTTFEAGNVIDSNLIEKYNYAAVYLSDLSGFSVKSNTMYPRASLTTSDAQNIYVTGTVGGGEIVKNTIVSNRRGSGIYMTDVKGAASPVLVANNFIHMGDVLSVAASRGVYILSINSAGILVANNSISLASDHADAGGLIIADGTNISLLNNNIGSFGTAAAMKWLKAYSVTQSDNNNLFATTISNIVGQNQFTLANHVATTGKDAASVSVNPGFNGTDLHTCAVELNGVGFPITAITEDYDGDTRSSIPDIGADEFFGDASSLLLQDSIFKCEGQAVTIGNVAQSDVTYVWAPSGGTSEISVTAPGNYTVTGTSACGSFSDTATVVDNELPMAAFVSSTVGLAVILTNQSTNGDSYLWNFGDGITSTEVSPTHVYASAGTYSVSLVVTNECGSDDFGPMPVNVINASINEVGDLQLQLFPNPTSGMFNITLSADIAAATLEIIDLSGKTVQNQNIPAGQNNISIDVSHLASGIYNVKIKSESFVGSIKLIKR